MRTAARPVVWLTILTLAPACEFVPGGEAGDPAGQPDAASPDPAPVDVVCRVEGPRLGVVGLRVQTGAIVVTFESWMARSNRPDELIGFTLAPSAAGVRYEVRTDRHTYQTEGLTWEIPDGRGSPEIDRIDFCRDD